MEAELSLEIVIIVSILKTLVHQRDTEKVAVMRATIKLLPDLTKCAPMLIRMGAHSLLRASDGFWRRS